MVPAPHNLLPSDDRLHAPVNAQVDAVFVLSVRSFHDRIAHIESELRKHGIAFEWVFEHDAVELSPELIEATFAPSDMGPPQQSLVLKHIETWKRCVARGYRRILVFEDDAILAPDFAQVFGDGNARGGFDRATVHDLSRMRRQQIRCPSATLEFGAG